MTDSSASQSDPDWHQSIYERLHEIAERALDRESPGHSLQPTLLVHDAYLKLTALNNFDPADRSQIMAIGANLVRQLLIDYARKRKAQKRGGEKKPENPLQVSLAPCASPVDLLELDEALQSLARESERAARVVELKFFGGLTHEEMSEQLDVSLRTIDYGWRFAKAGLYQQLGPLDESQTA